MRRKGADCLRKPVLPSSPPSGRRSPLPSQSRTDNRTCRSRSTWSGIGSNPITLIGASHFPLFGLPAVSGPVCIVVGTVIIDIIPAIRLAPAERDTRPNLSGTGDDRSLPPTAGKPPLLRPGNVFTCYIIHSYFALLKIKTIFGRHFGMTVPKGTEIPKGQNKSSRKTLTIKLFSNEHTC